MNITFTSFMCACLFIDCYLSYEFNTGSNAYFGGFLYLNNIVNVNAVINVICYWFLSLLCDVLLKVACYIHAYVYFNSLECLLIIVLTLLLRKCIYHLMI